MLKSIFKGIMLFTQIVSLIVKVNVTNETSSTLIKHQRTDVKKRAWFTINPTDKLDELKAKLDDFFIHIGSNHRTYYVVVQVPGVDLGEDKEEDRWKTVYFPQLVKDDSDVDYMFRVMVENNLLHLYVRSVEV
ncbi:hypothetical protein MTR_5g089130 [Medicago truncatula]|uniref:Uncharacterized protein n=1 Tax=Medicago truncatula TaxID=3880 RepID=G7KCV3_MEDTR|nr:hypothetical protein MTR_5g089130 [Medicago truncatula]